MRRRRVIIRLWQPHPCSTESSIRSKTQRRIDELGEKCNEGQLTDTEREEYDSYVRAIDFISILQAKARAVLQRNGG
jgi:hypothetical protein